MEPATRSRAIARATAWAVKNAARALSAKTVSKSSSVTSSTSAGRFVPALATST